MSLTKSVGSGSSADVSTSSQQTLEHIPQHAGVKRKAMPPGFLGNYMQARARMASVGLTPSIPETSGMSCNGQATGIKAAASGLGPPAASQRPAPFIPATTLPSLFAHRKQYLRAQRRANPDQQPYRQNEGYPTGLLSLPEDVLFKDVVVFHFNFTTPYRPSHEVSGPGQPRPPVRSRKRSVTNLAAVIARLGRGHRQIAPGVLQVSGARSTAPRALTFPDTSAA